MAIDSDDGEGITDAFLDALLKDLLCDPERREALGVYDASSRPTWTTVSYRAVVSERTSEHAWVSVLFHVPGSGITFSVKVDVARAVRTWSDDPDGNPLSPGALADRFCILLMETIETTDFNSLRGLDVREVYCLKQYG